MQNNLNVVEINSILNYEENFLITKKNYRASLKLYDIKHLYSQDDIEQKYQDNIVDLKNQQFKDFKVLKVAKEILNNAKSLTTYEFYLIATSRQRYSIDKRSEKNILKRPKALRNKVINIDNTDQQSISFIEKQDENKLIVSQEEGNFNHKDSLVLNREKIHNKGKHSKALRNKVINSDNIYQQFISLIEKQDENKLIASQEEGNFNHKDSLILNREKIHNKGIGISR